MTTNSNFPLNSASIMHHFGVSLVFLSLIIKKYDPKTVHFMKMSGLLGFQSNKICKLDNYYEKLNSSQNVDIVEKNNNSNPSSVN